eukprot:TRINITY_DN21207_c0_g1_i1.p1 TRINITY_DN21207_c0_g1~~TRINITY_DN21207_c0_g1_i1.p1  ORF type:complete len:1457 (+),score=377.50 TRINITY_DN21207_c0_g1_i1:143-4372(+)
MRKSPGRAVSTAGMSASSFTNREQWRKITYGLRDGPVNVAECRTLTAARPAKDTGRLRAVREAAKIQRMQAPPRHLQPLSKGKALVPLPDASASTAALRREYRSRVERERRHEQRAELLAAKPHGYQQQVVTAELKRPRELPPLRRVAGTPSQTPALPPDSGPTRSPEEAAPPSRVLSMRSNATSRRRRSSATPHPHSPVNRRRSSTADEIPSLAELKRIADEPTISRVRKEIRREAAVSVSASPVASPRQLWAEAADDANAALRADSACSDQAAVLAVRGAILAQTAYRVPTGHDFWERIQAVREGKSRAGAAEVLSRYRREAEASIANVHDFILRLYRATGLRLSLFAHTRLDLGVFDSPGGRAGVRPMLTLMATANPSLGWLSTLLQSASDFDGTGTSGSADSVSMTPDTDADAVLQSTSDADMPEVPPGWFVAKDEDTAGEFHVCVAGTQNLNDCFRDCTFVPVPMRMPAGYHCPPPGAWASLKVHMGFLDGAERIWWELLPALRRARASREKIRVHLTGHSLGGATAILLACFLHEAGKAEGIEVVSMHTYGAPNVFVIEEWPCELELLPGVEQHQYVNSRDVVPRALGSAVIRKLAKLAIRLGFRALACVTQENAESLPLYRFVGPLLHFITADGAVSDVQSREEQTQVLALSATDLRPQAGIDHKMGSYITKLIARLDSLTGYTHKYSQEVIVAAGASVTHPVSAAVFDEKEAMQLSKSFVEVVGNLFTRFCTPSGGIDREALGGLFSWTGKTYPAYLIDSLILRGRYETADGELTRDGWRTFMEDQCYVDLQWVDKVLRETGWQRDGKSLSLRKKTEEGQRCRDDIVPGALLDVEPLVSGGRLNSEADAVVCELFDAYRRALPPDVFPASPGGRQKYFFKLESVDPAVRPEAMHVFARNVNTLEFAAADSGEVDESTVARVAAASATAWVDAAGRTKGGTDAFGNVTLAGWRQMWLELGTADAPRAFQLLCGGAGWNGRDSLCARNGQLWETEGVDESLKQADQMTRDQTAAAQAQADEQFRQKLWKILKQRKRRVSRPVSPTPKSPPGDAVEQSPRSKAALLSVPLSPTSSWRGAKQKLPDVDPALPASTRKLLRRAMRKERHRVRVMQNRQAHINDVYLATQPQGLERSVPADRSSSSRAAHSKAADTQRRRRKRAGGKEAVECPIVPELYLHNAKRRHQWVIASTAAEYEYVPSTNDFDAPFAHATARERLSAASRAASPKQSGGADAPPGSRRASTRAAVPPAADDDDPKSERPLQLWWSTARKDHVCTATSEAAVAARDRGYHCCGTMCHLLGGPGEGTTPLILFYHPTKGDHACVASPSGIAWAQREGYEEQGPIGHLYVSPPGGMETVPVERWRCGQYGDTVVVAGDAMLRMLKAEELRGLRYVKKSVEGYALL